MEKLSFFPGFHLSADVSCRADVMFTRLVTASFCKVRNAEKDRDRQSGQVAFEKRLTRFLIYPYDPASKF